jgi:MerR family mercuric resistance operon transcriptional regulator
MSKTRTIGKLAKAVGVGVETVRFYERQGLIAQPRKGDGPRHYDDKALATLRYIRIAQQLGLSPKEIRALQAQLANGKSFCPSLRGTVEKKLIALAQEAAEIARLQGELQAFLTRCRSRNPVLACPIVEELTRLDTAIALVISDSPVPSSASTICAASGRCTAPEFGFAKPSLTSAPSRDETGQGAADTVKSIRRFFRLAAGLTPASIGLVEP